MRLILCGLVILAAAPLLAYADALKVGDAAPAVTAAGWLNGEPPKVEDRKGHVMVVDFYASW